MLPCYLPPESFQTSAEWILSGSKQGRQPVAISASKAPVHRLLDHIYSGQPELNWNGLELLRLAEAYDLPKLADAIGAGFENLSESNFETNGCVNGSWDFLGVLVSLTMMGTKRPALQSHSYFNIF